MTLRIPGRRPPGRSRLVARAGSIAPLLAVAAMLASASAGAALWKWTDANGRVIYSDIPPTADVKVERVNAPPPRANPNAPKEMLSQEQEFRKRQMQRAEDQTKAEKAKTETAQRQEQCSLMRGQLKSYQLENVQHYRINEKGERVFLDAEALKQQREKLELAIKEQCQPAT